MLVCHSTYVDLSTLSCSGSSLVCCEVLHKPHSVEAVASCIIGVCSHFLNPPTTTHHRAAQAHPAASSTMAVLWPPMQVGRLIEEGASTFQPGSGMEPPLRRNNLTAERVLDMTERVIMNGGDPSDGECGPKSATAAAAVVCRGLWQLVMARNHHTLLHFCLSSLTPLPTLLFSFAGQWQFVMGSAASESLFGWKRVTDWAENQNCSVR